MFLVSLVAVFVNIRPSNGITAPSTGVRRGTTGESGIYLTTASAAGSVTAPPTDYVYPEVKTGVGIAEASINSFTPALAGAATRMVLNFTNVSPLTTASGATVKVELPGFTSDTALGTLQVRKNGQEAQRAQGDIDSHVKSLFIRVSVL
jgi:hypothetical protein